MNHDELNDIYFEWMCQLISDEDHDSLSYQLMLQELHHTPFEYTLPMDENREADGIDLRYRFGREQRIEARVIASVLDITPCSVMEVLVALAVRCEEHIMANPEYGDRTSEWFWTMMENLGLDRMTDRRFRSDEFYYIIDRFLDREYGPHGEGGLFYIPNPRRDLRTVDIWYQLMWYLSSSVRE